MVDSARPVVAPPQAPGPAPWPVRLCASAPYLLAAALLTVTFVDYVSGPIQLSAQVRDVSGWLRYELLACVYASVLPLGMLVLGVARALLRRPARESGGDGSLLLLLPFACLAWAVTPAALGPWGVVAFLALAFARWIPYRRDAGLIRDGVRGVLGSAARAVRVWTFFTAAFILSAFLVLPLEPLLGLEMPSVEHGQYFLFLGGGILYFLLNGLFELFDIAHRFTPGARLHLPPSPRLAGRVPSTGADAA